jgi:hypothetical protein
MPIRKDKGKERLSLRLSSIFRPQWNTKYHHYGHVEQAIELERARSQSETTKPAVRALLFLTG